MLYHDESALRALGKLEVMIRFNLTERIEEIERLAQEAGWSVRWRKVYEQEGQAYGLLTALSSGPLN